MSTHRSQRNGATACPPSAADAMPAGLLPGELRLVRVGPEWAARFAAERLRLTAALGPAALDVQHVGSTAVPGLLAKPILDLAVAIDTFEQGHALVATIEGLGYRYRGENGVPRRHYFTLGAPRRLHHLHVLEHTGQPWAQHLRFRDRLRASTALAERYTRLKTELLAENAVHRARYQQLKAAFIESESVDSARR